MCVANAARLPPPPPPQRGLTAAAACHVCCTCDGRPYDTGEHHLYRIGQVSTHVLPAEASSWPAVQAGTIHAHCRAQTLPRPSCPSNRLPRSVSVPCGGQHLQLLLPPWTLDAFFQLQAAQMPRLRLKKGLKRHPQTPMHVRAGCSSNQNRKEQTMACKGLNR